MIKTYKSIKVNTGEGWRWVAGRVAGSSTCIKYSMTPDPRITEDELAEYEEAFPLYTFEVDTIPTEYL